MKRTRGPKRDPVTGQYLVTERLKTVLRKGVYRIERVKGSKVLGETIVMASGPNAPGIVMMEYQAGGSGGLSIVTPQLWPNADIVTLPVPAQDGDSPAHTRLKAAARESETDLGTRLTGLSDEEFLAALCG